MNLLPLLLVFIGGIILTVGDIAMKKWVDSNDVYIYLLGMFIYFIGMNFLSVSFKYKNIAVASTFLVIFNVVSLIILSWILFEEKITLTQMIGILLGIIAVAVLELGEKEI